VATHALLPHVLVRQSWPQEPQFFASNDVSTQAPWQQTPFEHVEPQQDAPTTPHCGDVSATTTSTIVMSGIAS